MEAFLVYLATLTFTQLITLICIIVGAFCVLMVAIVFLVRSSKIEKIGLGGVEFDQDD